MAKLEGYTKVAVVKYGSCDYHFAIYEDGTDYKAGDMVLLSGNSTPNKIEEIITVEEAKERFKKDITAEVICRVDTSAYDKRVEQRKEKEKLRKEMDKRKKELDKLKQDEYYAMIDSGYRDMLMKFNSL